MGKYRQLAEAIVKNVGGESNVSSVTHCITRLRFRLKDESRANDDVLKNMDGVVTVMHSAGQYQVVIGNHVPMVYEDVCQVLGIGKDAQPAETQEEAPKGVFNKLIDIISGCFQPILGPLCASGIIRGLNALLVFILGTSYNNSGTYAILNAIGDSIFYFLPIILGYTAAKKFNVNVVVGMIIGFLLTYFLWNDQSGENAAAENGNGTKGSGAGAVEDAVLSAAKEEETILSPMSGQVIGLGELKDEAFNSGMMGDGVGLVPTEGKVVSPVAGTISTLFPTFHAIGITSDSGAEILVHVGMDTVELNGKGFKAYVKQDDHVAQGQHLLDVDLKTIKDAGYSIQTPVLVVNSADMREVEKTDKKEVKINESLMTVKYAR